VIVVSLWKLGACISALTTLVALVVHLQFSSQQIPTQITEQSPSEIWHFESFDAWWLEESQECVVSNSCVYVVILETHQCDQDVIVDFTITDSKDLFIDSQTQIIPASRFKSGQAFEIGTDTNEVEYFAIEQVSCGLGWDTTQHEI
jgi:hypothetical protein